MAGRPGASSASRSPAGRPCCRRSTGCSHDRKRMGEIFEFDYVLEMYKPAAQRRWGYYALPILYGDRLVGKLDARADRDGRGAPGRGGPPGRAVQQGHDHRGRPRDHRPGALARPGARAA